MELGRKAVGSAAHTESLRVVRRLRELVPQVGPTEAARVVGCSPEWASKVARKERATTLDVPTIAGLELRRSSKLCRKCGNEAVLVTKDHTCVICTLLELGKQGQVEIQPETGTNEN
jgi:hypothetical protein